MKTLIELNALDHYTYTDTDGIQKVIDVEHDYCPEGFVDYEYVETHTIAWPWLHDFNNWLFRKNYQSCDSTDWSDLPF